jgi:hypothetical protein
VLCAEAVNNNATVTEEDMESHYVTEDKELVLSKFNDFLNSKRRDTDSCGMIVFGCIINAEGNDKFKLTSGYLPATYKLAFLQEAIDFLILRQAQEDKKAIETELAARGEAEQPDKPQPESATEAGTL